MEARILREVFGAPLLKDATSMVTLEEIMSTRGVEHWRVTAERIKNVIWKLYWRGRIKEFKTPMSVDRWYNSRTGETQRHIGHLDHVRRVAMIIATRVTQLSRDTRQLVAQHVWNTRWNEAWKKYI